MSKSMEEERRAVECGYWHLYRFNPQLMHEGKNPFTLDSKAPTAELKEFLSGENRFASLKNIDPERAEELFSRAEKESKARFALYQKLSMLFEPQT